MRDKSHTDKWKRGREAEGERGPFCWTDIFDNRIIKTKCSRLCSHRASMPVTHKV